MPRRLAHLALVLFLLLAGCSRRPEPLDVDLLLPRSRFYNTTADKIPRERLRFQEQLRTPDYVEVTLYGDYDTHVLNWDQRLRLHRDGHVEIQDSPGAPWRDDTLR